MIALIFFLFLEPIINDGNYRVPDGWFLHPELNVKYSFADRKLKLAVEISGRGSILFNTLTLSSLNIVTWL